MMGCIDLAEHPRVRGENSLNGRALAHQKGTSPRARGKRIRQLACLCNLRNIPACAGKTMGHRIKPFTGEGTSPRARGKPESRGHRVGLTRNIPACAGKTSCKTTSSLVNAEHPRVRGENLPVVCPPHGPPGTSPRARGKRPSQTLLRIRNRNIPACAGKTCKCDQPHTVMAEHPRVRGENKGTFQ